MGRRETATHILSSIGRMIRHDTKENYVIDGLGLNGPQTVSSLKSKTRILPSNSYVLSNSEIYRVLDDLKTKGVVEEFLKERGAVFGLTFKGMIDYLRNDGPELDIRKAIHLVNLFENPFGGTPPKRSAKHRQMVATRDYLEKLFPFLPAWKSIVDSTGDEKRCLKILQTTINDFPYEPIEPRSTVIEPLEFEVKIFQDTPNDYDLANSPCMRPFFTKYLARDEAKKLREAYWAYLVQQYLNRIRNMSKEEFAEAMPELKCRNEILQSQKVLPAPSLNKKELSGFFQNYGSVEYYFVGVFVYNLLWIDKILEKQPLE